MSLSSTKHEDYNVRVKNADKVIETICNDTVRTMYGTEVPYIVQKRLSVELAVIAMHSYATQYLIGSKIAKFSMTNGYRISTRGAVGSTLVAYLLGITEINPLSAHYRCPSCFYTEFIGESELSGFDLPVKHCPICGAKLVGDGTDIIAEMSMGINYDKEPNITINIAPEILSDVIKMLKCWMKTENIGVNIIGAGVSVTLEDGSIRKGVHPGGLFLVPKGVDISEITDLRKDVRDDGLSLMVTEENYSYVENYMKKYDVLSFPKLGVLHELEKITGIPISTMPIDCKTISDVMENLPDSFWEGNQLNRLVYSIVKPSCFLDLVKMEGLAHASFTDLYDIDAEPYLRKASEMGVSSRDDIMKYLLQKGWDREDAYNIMRQVAIKGKRLTDDMISCLNEFCVGEEFIDLVDRIRYLYPRSQNAAYALMTWRMAYYCSECSDYYMKIMKERSN